MLTTAAAHNGDVNVISWSRREPFLLSGGDDGALKVWDLRQFKVSPQPGPQGLGRLWALNPAEEAGTKDVGVSRGVTPQHCASLPCLFLFLRLLGIPNSCLPFHTWSCLLSRGLHREVGTQCFCPHTSWAVQTL